MSATSGQSEAHGEICSYKCPDWVFWAVLSPKALDPIGPIFNQKWFAVCTLAKIGVVDSATNFILILYDQEVRDGLIGQSLLGFKNKVVNILVRTESTLEDHRTLKLTAVVIPAMPAPLRP